MTLVPRIAFVGMHFGSGFGMLVRSFLSMRVLLFVQQRTVSCHCRRLFILKMNYSIGPIDRFKSLHPACFVAS